MTAGAATLPLAPTSSPAAQMAWVAVVGGTALLPDLDHPAATAARMWGPITGALGRVLRTLGRGHRGGTHDLLVAPAVFGLLAWAASWHPLSSAIMIALAIGLAIRGCEFILPGRIGEIVVINMTLSAVLTWLILTHAVTTSWLPYAVALGVAVHILGDAVTRTSVPIPFTWLVGKADRDRGLLLTGRWYENWLIAPAFLIATGVLLWWHVPAIGTAVHAVATSFGLTPGGNP